MGIFTDDPTDTPTPDDSVQMGSIFPSKIGTDPDLLKAGAGEAAPRPPAPSFFDRWKANLSPDKVPAIRSGLRAIQLANRPFQAAGEVLGTALGGDQENQKAFDTGVSDMFSGRRSLRDFAGGLISSFEQRPPQEQTVLMAGMAGEMPEANAGVSASRAVALDRAAAVASDAVVRAGKVLTEPDTTLWGGNQVNPYAVGRVPAGGVSGAGGQGDIRSIKLPGSLIPGEAGRAAQPSPDPLYPRTVDEQAAFEKEQQARPRSGLTPGAPALPNEMTAGPLGMQDSRIPPYEVPTETPSGRRPGGIQNQVPLPPGPSEYEKLVAGIEPPRDPPTLKGALAAAAEHLSDRNFVLADLSKRTGIPVHELAQNVPGAVEAGKDTLRTYAAPIIATVGKDTVELEQYMVMMRDSDLGPRPGMRLPGGVNPTRLGEIEDSLLAKVGVRRFQAIRDAATDLWKFNDEHYLRPLRDEGIISDGQYLAMKSDHPHYIPFGREDFADQVAKTFSRPEANVSSTGIRALTEEGSGRALHTPLQSLLGQVIKGQQIIARNKAATATVQALRAMEKAPGELVHDIEPKGAMNLQQRVTGEINASRISKGESSRIWETMSYFENGDKHVVEVPAVFGRVAKGLDYQGAGLWDTIFRSITGPFRAGVVSYNPFSIPMFLAHHAGSAFMRERMMPSDFFRGLRGTLLKNEDYHAAAQSGALVSDLLDGMNGPTAWSSMTRKLSGTPMGHKLGWDTPSAANLSRMTRGAITVDNAADVALWLPRLIRETHTTLLNASRLGTYTKLRAQGLDTIVAAARARDATLDFSKSGLTVRVLDQIAPFSNAALQGTGLVARTVKEQPGWALGLAAMASMPSVLAWANNRRYQTADQIPGYEFSRYWPVVIGEGTDAQGQKYPIYVKVPKGQPMSMFSFPAEALLQVANHKDNRSAAEVLLEASANVARTNDLGGVSSTANPVGRVPFLNAAQGMGTGTDLGTGLPIVPRAQQGLGNELQYGAVTSKTAIALGQKTGISPDKIDFALRNTTGTAGAATNWLASLALEALGYNPPVYGAGKAAAVAPGGLAPRVSGPKKVANTGAQVASAVPGMSQLVGTKANAESTIGYNQLNKAMTDGNRAFHAIPHIVEDGISLSLVPSKASLLPSASGVDIALTPAQMAEWQKSYSDLAIRGVKAASGLLTGNVAHDTPIVQPIDTLARSDALNNILDKLPAPLDPTLNRAFAFRQLLQASGYKDVELDNPTLSASPTLMSRYQVYKALRSDGDAGMRAAGLSQTTIDILKGVDSAIADRKKELRLNVRGLDVGLVRYYDDTPETDAGRAMKTLRDIQQGRQKAAA